MFNAAKYCGIISTPLENEANNKYKLLDIKLRNEKYFKLYEDAICTLNKLQQKFQKLQRIKENNLESVYKKGLKLDETRKYLIRSGILLENLDKLSVVHVSGTKGKGSTCALTESILRSFGMKTGFFSSPHLISVTERFRLNGEPISQKKFIKYFWKVYKRLDEQKDDEIDMPGYFQFLTILCFHIFLDEKVDVAVIEVGIGGENDCTNILRNTKTIGITSLGLEHVQLLGYTLNQIAWHKAGIIKENSNVFTVIQPDECTEIIKQKANEKNAKLQIVPDYSKYNWIEEPKLQIRHKTQGINASLAIQLAYDWLRTNQPDKFSAILKNCSEKKLILEVPQNAIEGLEKCFWPGRCQLIKYNNLRIYLDGAHTVESIDVCIDWFKKSTSTSLNTKILIFNSTGVRDSLTLLSMLKKEIQFAVPCFVPNIPYCDITNFRNPDVTTFISNEEHILRTKIHSEVWNSNANVDDCFACILDALKFISKKFNKTEVIDVLVTGSMHLIGNTLLALEEFDKELQ